MTSRSPSASIVCGRPYVSTKPTTTSVPRSLAAVALLEHGVGLADARRHAEIEQSARARPRPPRGGRAPASARRWAGPDRGSLAGHVPVNHAQPEPSTARLVERQVQLEHVHARLAEEAEQCGPRCARRPASRTCVFGQAARVGDARHLEQRVGGRDVRVEAAGRRGHGVDRHRRVGGQAVLLAVGGRALGRRGRAASGWSGPRFEPLEAGRVVAVARPPTGAGGSTPGRVNVLADQRRADDVAVASRIRLPSAWSGKTTWAMPVIDQRVGEPGEDRAARQSAATRCGWSRRSGGRCCRDRVSSPLRQPDAPRRCTSISLMPMNGTMMPPRP